MKKVILKKILLCALLISALCLSGCRNKVDNTVDAQATDQMNVLPFDTSTPAPTADPNATDGEYQDWSSQATALIVTASPTPAVQIVTATPTLRPAWTYSPATPAPTDDGTLRSGSTGSAVRALQTVLQQLGYYTGNIDGSFGAGTEAAVREFQRNNGLVADGVAGKNTLNRLYSDSAKAAPAATPEYLYPTDRPTPLTYVASTPSTYRYLQLGSTGNDVRVLQNVLFQLGYYNGNATGTYDLATQNAVSLFQQRNGLWVDGVAGEDTQRMLYSANALPYAPSISLTATPYAYRTLKKGMSGDDVMQLQLRLQELFYYNGTANGVYDDATELSVKVFQQRNGLTVDGIAGNQTQSLLFGSTAMPAPTIAPAYTPNPQETTLELGQTGENIYSLQERLYDLGYYNGRIDGVYSEELEDAVKAFQENNGLTVDGKVGRRTKEILNSAAAVPASGAQAAYTTLQYGDSGEAVRALQSLLKNLGYYTAEINGNYDQNTALAVQQFQSVNGLTADGVAGPATLQLLYGGTPLPAPTVEALSYPALMSGSKGDAVTQLQQFLTDFGYYASVIDGEYGESTRQAVIAFQENNGLTADGVAGHDTQALLFSGRGVAALPATPEATARTKLQSGDSGADVLDLQMRLIALGYLSGNADGSFGGATLSAVQAFQRANGLASDGVAGPATMQALYAANVVYAGDTGSQIAGSLSNISNRQRELEEQNATGAIQASLAGGGVAASHGGQVYYAGGADGSLYVGDTQVYAGPARYIHASDKGVTFVSDSQVIRIDQSGNQQVLCQAGGIEKFQLVSDIMYYLEGSTLVRMSMDGQTAALTSGAQDFCVDIYQYMAYVASDEGVRRIALNGSSETMLVSTPCRQVQLADSVVFFLSQDGAIYRLENGLSVKVLDAEVSWFAVYREHIYFITDDHLYRCDTNGQNADVFYDGLCASVSFVAGQAYVTETAGGPVVAKLPTD